MRRLGVDVANPDLQALLVKWQAVLRLQDWDIEILYVKSFDLEVNTGGHVVRCDAKKTARVKVLDPDLYDPCLIVKQDVEYTVVHELVHIHFALIDDFKDTNNALYEQAVHRISKALLSLDRIVR